MKKTISLLLMLVMCLILCACSKNSGIKERQILSDIPEQFLTIDRLALNYDGIDVNKRNTKDGVDDIYFTLDASNENYEVTAQCHFVYNYYSEGGWILDYAEIVNGEYTVVPLSGCSSYSSETDMQETYANYELVKSDFGSDGNCYYTQYQYEGTNEWELYSQKVSVDYKYTFASQLEYSAETNNILCSNIFTYWELDKYEDIISDNWVLDLDINGNGYYDDETISLTISPADDGTHSINYEAYSADLILSWCECVGSGTAEYEVIYEGLDAPYVSFVIQLCYICDDGSLDYKNPYDYKVKIYKDHIWIEHFYRNIEYS